MDGLRNFVETSPAHVVAEIWSKRSFLGFFAFSKVKASLSESKTAAFWWLLEPAIKVAIYGSIFGLILPASSRPDNFVLSLIIGVAIFELYATHSSSSTRFLAQSKVIEESTSITPWSLMVSTLVETHIRTGAFVLIILSSALLFGVAPAWSWLAFPLVVVGASFFLYSVGLIVAALSRMFPTFPRLLGAFNRVVFYASGIFWSIERVLASYPVLLRAAEINPVYQIIQMARATVLGDDIDWAQLLLFHSVITVVLLTAGIILFSRANKGDYE